MRENNNKIIYDNITFADILRHVLKLDECNHYMWPFQATQK